MNLQKSTISEVQKLAPKLNHLIHLTYFLRYTEGIRKVKLAFEDG